MKKSFYIGICATTISNGLLAGTIGALPEPNQYFFAGGGGSYTSAAVHKQTVYGRGVSRTYTAGVLTSIGSAAGTSSPFYQNQTNLSPHAQVGYLRHFNNTSYFWGAKFAYDYINTFLSDINMTIPQAGANTNVINGSITPFTGNYFVDSVQTHINHEFLLLALIGHSFEYSKVYLGIGPTVFGMQNRINQFVGYADYNGQQATDISGVPANLSKKYWQWGGAAQLGAIYSLNPTWFLDFSYTYAMVGRNTIKYVSPFTNQIGVDNLVGNSFIHPSQFESAQSFTISINGAFNV
ncbi:hypothetical protein EP47_06325 [Legionella norrlandica]|uniref:Outer membrane protein beta-barrel domain-containing protein n=1 Tax=Legionella norrlandica TaxID=1498499 RepID=A0A0A2SNU2_9GAMM|nr:hypothetical protein [Legionella norrlandica]KGP62382.1 hypothetical protein EP47_06325 [Legionella norrlandica]